jgi:hypothetical protein
MANSLNTTVFSVNNPGAITVNGSDEANAEARGAIFIVNVSAVSGGATLTLSLQAKDPVSGNYVTVGGATTTALAAAGTTVLTVYPGVTTAANVAFSFPLPMIYRLQGVVAGGNITATVSAHLIN